MLFCNSEVLIAVILAIPGIYFFFSFAMEKWDEIHRFAGYKCYHLTIPLDMLFPHDVHFQLQGLKTISTWNFKSNRDQLCNWNKAWTSISKLSFVVFSCFSLPKRWTPTEFCCRSPKTRAPWQLPPLSGTWPTVPAALRTLRTADSCGCTQRRWSSMGRGTVVVLHGGYWKNKFGLDDVAWKI